jgi:hypothetical protein
VAADLALKRNTAETQAWHDRCNLDGLDVPEREKPPLRRGVIAAALLSVSVVAGLAWAGAASASAVTWGLGPAVVHPGSAVELYGTKDPANSLSIEVTPPGNAWSAIDGYCVGLGVGSSDWSCSVPGEHSLGNHQVRLVESNGAVQSGRFIVVPDAAHAEQVAPPPPPPPPPPAPTGTPTPEPTPKVQARDEQLDTLALAEEGSSADTDAPPVPADAPVTSLPTSAGGDTATPRTQARGDHDAIPRSDPAAPGILSQTIPTWERLLAHPLTFLAAAGIGGLILLLVAIPANILDATVEANSARLAAPFARFAPLFAKLGRLRARIPRVPLTAPLMIVLATFAFAFADPHFGFDITSLRTTAALAIGLLLVVMLPIAITRVLLGRRWSVPAQIVAKPGALILAVAGVLASRTFGFYPGLLIGLVVGLELAAGARDSDRSRAITVRLASTLSIALLAWVGYSWLTVTTAGTDPVFFTQLLGDTLVAAAVEGLTGVMVALLPVTFLDGRDLFNGSRRAWLAIAIPGAFAFSLIVLPTVITDDGPEAPLGLWITVLAAFSLLVAAVWFTLRALDRRDARRATAPVGSDAG